MFPRRFTWRLLAALLLLGAVSFAFQRSAYVAEEYHSWLWTRLQDNRHLYKQRVAPRDLWMLLQWAHLHLAASAYQMMQVTSGGAIAVYAVVARLRQRPLQPLLVSVFIFAICWMLLLGPASESATYVILAPVVVLTLIQAFGESAPGCWRWATLVSFMLLVASLGVNSFTHSNRALWAMSLQPLAALIFTIAYVIHLFAGARRSFPSAG